MKKIALLFLLLLAIQPALKAQFEFGVGLTPQTTWLINNNVSDQGDNLNYSTSFGVNAGLRGAFFFNHKIGVGAELNLNWFNQKYSGDFPSFTGASYEAADHLQYFSVPLLLEMKTPGGFYFEIGPQFNFLTSAKEDLNITGEVDTSLYTGRNVKTGFNTSMIGGMFGLGGRFQLAGNLIMIAGLRLMGSLNDATTELSQAEFNEAGVNDELGIAVAFAHTDQHGVFSYDKTLAVSGGIVIGLVYAIGGDTAKK